MKSLSESMRETLTLLEGAKVDRMVGHIKKSEKKLGHDSEEAEDIAWATANKRGMLKNKKKVKESLGLWIIKDNGEVYGSYPEYDEAYDTFVTLVTHGNGNIQMINPNGDIEEESDAWNSSGLSEAKGMSAASIANDERLKRTNPEEYAKLLKRRESARRSAAKARENKLANAEKIQASLDDRIRRVKASGLSIEEKRAKLAKLKAMVTTLHDAFSTFKPIPTGTTSSVAPGSVASTPSSRNQTTSKVQPTQSQPDPDDSSIIGNAIAGGLGSMVTGGDFLPGAAAGGLLGSGPLSSGLMGAAAGWFFGDDDN